jgi:hypothetical protein
VNIQRGGKPTIPGETKKANRTIGTVFFAEIMIRMTVADYSTETRARCGEILGCALVGSLGILLLDALVLHSGVYYYSDDIYVLYSVAVNSLTPIPWHVVRPLQYLIVLAHCCPVNKRIDSFG